MDGKWTLIKVSKATRARLEKVRLSLLMAEDGGQLQLDRDNRDRVSLDQVIGLLIGLRERHAARRKRASDKRRGKQAELFEQANTIDPESWRELLASAVDPEKLPASFV